jgi:putative ABC transport system permease protein
MLVFEIIMVAFAAVRANLLRSTLTTLGIVIGIAAVITMVALGEGAQERVQEDIDRMGTTVLTIRPGQNMWGGIGRGDTQMSIGDAIALRAGAGQLMSVSPEQESRMQITFSRWNSNSTVKGVWPEYFDIYNHELQLGRTFTQGEVQGRRRVAVLGYNMPEMLGETPPELLVGNTIQIRGIPFEVIGVLEEKGESMRFRPDDQIFIPQSTAQYRDRYGRGAGCSLRRDRSDLQARASNTAGRGRRLQHQQCGGVHRGTERDPEDIRDALGRNRRRELVGRRDRDHEHHACFGHRADA